jgi:hypothetical protein
MNPSELKQSVAAVGSSDVLGIVNRTAARLGEMQWNSMDDLTETDFKIEIAKAVHAAWAHGMEEAADICEAHARTGNPEGWTDLVSRECQKLILERMVVVATMPNDPKLSHGAKTEGEQNGGRP